MDYTALSATLDRSLLYLGGGLDRSTMLCTSSAFGLCPSPSLSRGHGVESTEQAQGLRQ